MKKLICIVAAIIASVSCTNQSRPMVLEYAIHYPDGVVIKEHNFYGTEKAFAKVHVKTHWSSTHEKILLWWGWGPLADEKVFESTVPLEIRRIYCKDDERIQDQ